MKPFGAKEVLILGRWLRDDSCSGAGAPWAELEAVRAPQGGVPSASGWGGPLGAFQARHHPRSGVATVSPRYCYGIATVYPRCISHVDGINMGDTPGIYRGYTVCTPCLLAWGCVPPSLESRRGSVQRKR